jgi:membrane protein implicated in regulation of membrane protease activity
VIRHPAFWRYTAFQIPGWIIASIGGWWVHRWLDVPPWVASGVLVVWVIKDYVLFPFLRSAYELDHRLPIERLIGEHGKATDQLSPDGYIRVRGELWRAKSDTNLTIERGVLVEVRGVEGNTLIVGRKS